MVIVVEFELAIEQRVEEVVELAALVGMARQMAVVWEGPSFVLFFF